MLKLNFQGEQAEKPYISDMVKKYGLDVNILGGTIDELADDKVGHLLVEILGSDTDRNSAINWLKENKIEVEEV